MDGSVPSKGPIGASTNGARSGKEVGQPGQTDWTVDKGAPKRTDTEPDPKKEVGQPDRINRQTDWTADKGAPKRTDKEPDPPQKRKWDNRTGQTDWTADNSAPKRTDTEPEQKKETGQPDRLDSWTMDSGASKGTAVS